MAEFHLKATLGDHDSNGSSDVGDLMYNIYSAVANSNQKVVRFATHNSNTGVYIDTTANGTANAFGTPTSGAMFAASGTSYMIIEPVDEYFSGGGRWQLKISRYSAGLHYELAQDGGWDSATGNFTPSTSGDVNIHGSGAVSGTDVYFSAATETYNVSQEYSYLKVILRDGSSNCIWALYCGGYIPFSPTVDTKPILVLAGSPQSSAGWNINSSATLNRTHADYAHSSAPTRKVSVESIASIVGGSGHDYSGNYIAPSAYIVTDSGATLGILGPTTTRGFDGTVPDWSMDSSGAYVKAGLYLHRFVS